MKFGSQAIEKLEYAQFLAASLAYLAHLQRDAAGLIVFDDEVRNFVRPPRGRASCAGCCTAIEKAETGTRTDFARPFHAPAWIFCAGAGWWW